MIYFNIPYSDNICPHKKTHIGPTSHCSQCDFICYLTNDNYIGAVRILLDGIYIYLYENRASFIYNSGLYKDFKFPLIKPPIDPITLKNKLNKILLLL